MKIWNGYSSEHSASLVMIGHFKDAESVDSFLKELDAIKEQIAKESDGCDTADRFPEELLNKLVRQEYKFCSDLAPKDLNDFQMSLNFEKDANDPRVVRFSSSDTGWAGLIKMMVNAGARIEVFDEQLVKDQNET